jgi:hypothetical protein
MKSSFRLQANGSSIAWSLREPFMAVIDHHVRSTHETNVCAVKFCLTWVGFFVAIGVFTYLVSMI